MSGIFGYIENSNYDTASSLDGLRFWNQDYGSREMEYCEGNATVGVNLEHFSKQVPEQSRMLRDNNRVAVIDSILFNREEMINRFQSDMSGYSDEELLFQIVCRFGYDALKDVNGEFAGAVYNEETGELVLFRDHLGLRPVYYYVDCNRVLFATDIRGILASDAITVSIDEDYIYEQAANLFRNVENNTEYKEIRYLRKASYVLIDTKGDNAGNEKQHIYWHPGRNKIRYPSDQAYQTALRELVEDAIKIRIKTTDDPVGAELSGGLDSTVISCLTKRFADKTFYYSWSTDPKEKPIESGKDERLLIEEICDREGISCEYRKLNNPEESLAGKPLKYQIIPGFTTAMTVSSASSWFQKQGVHVVFTGHGGDEGISHRSTIYELWYHKEYISYIKELYHLTKGKSFRILRTMKWLYNNIIKTDMTVLDARYQEGSLLEFLTPEFREKASNSFPVSEYTYFYDPIKYIESGAIRHRMDNTAFQTVKYGIRYMYPFLDYRLIDFAVSIPRKMYIRNGQNRWIYRETFSDLMPKSIKQLYTKSTFVQKKESDITEKSIQHHEFLMKSTIDLLDRDYWGQYLDFDKLDQYKLPEKPTLDDMEIYLSRCCKLDVYGVCYTAMKKASEPVRLFEEEK